MDRLAQKELKRLLHYDPDTGVFTNKTTRCRAIKGSVAGKAATVHPQLISIYKKHLTKRRNVMQWFIANYIGIGFALGALDIVLGALPDSITKYPGGILKLAHELYAYGKVK